MRILLILLLGLNAFLGDSAGGCIEDQRDVFAAFREIHVQLLTPSQQGACQGDGTRVLARRNSICFFFHLGLFTVVIC